MKHKFYIVNEFDRPCPEHVCIKRGDRLFYIHPILRDDTAFLKGIPIREDSTPVEDFGFDIKSTGDIVSFNKTNESKATYEGGDKRLWQGEAAFTIRIPARLQKPYIEGTEVYVLDIEITDTYIAAVEAMSLDEAKDKAELIAFEGGEAEFIEQSRYTKVEEN